ncbi:zymogen granule membrane protein 16-like [Emydura macquarii macquarii]|uniref:zymogen granule membrane protein 16-like n=1 Tax=Emydura macquarii macquarii TaxID=1129001 RepID=UPI00352B036D
MLQFLFLTVVAASVCRGQDQSVTASFSGLYGGTVGDEFSQTSYEIVGPITAVKIWTGVATLHGIQVSYGNVWSNLNGAAWGTMVEMYLEPNENIVQVQGSYAYWVVTSLTFITSLGRTFVFGNQSGSTFLALPLDQGAVLRAVSGRAGTYLYAIGFHWGAYPTKAMPCKA